MCPNSKSSLVPVYRAIFKQSLLQLSMCQELCQVLYVVRWILLTSMKFFLKWHSQSWNLSLSSKPLDITLLCYYMLFYYPDILSFKGLMKASETSEGSLLQTDPSHSRMGSASVHKMLRGREGIKG